MTRIPGAVWAAATLALAAAAAMAQPRAIDAEKSVMTVRVFKAGFLSAFGHEHDVAAPIARGSADPAAHRVELRVNAAALRVLDPKASPSDRAEVEKTMLGPEVLDAAHYPEIVFQSAGVEAAGPGSWTVKGSLQLHGRTGPVTVAVREQGGHYVGTARVKQTDFGMKPVTAAGGTVRVKDEVLIEFDVQLSR
jgi:polyisoprenoid-binding protein YceI